MQRPVPVAANEEFSLKATTPNIAATDRPVASTFDLVEQMHYLYVRVVKAKDLYCGDNDSYEPFVELRLGNYKGRTNCKEKNPNPEWNQVIAFPKDRILSPFLEISMRDKNNCDYSEDDHIKGKVMYDVNEAPKRVPPDSPLAPQWYRLEGSRRERVRGELMLAIWMGTQADEAFPEAWHCDITEGGGVTADGMKNIKSKVYSSPKLWYLRVNVIGAQDLDPKDKKNPRMEACVKAVLGGFTLKTKFSAAKSTTVNPLWNEDLMFVAAEPFEDQLVLSVEHKLGNKEEVLGTCTIHLVTLERRFTHKPVDARWFNLEKPPRKKEGNNQTQTAAAAAAAAEGNQTETADQSNYQTATAADHVGFGGKLHLRVSLDGGYHVLDGTTHYSSDLRPTVRQLWRSGIGVLELGILNAAGLPPMKTRDGRGTTDAYCVAKYGQKWVRTRTIIDSSSPQWHEQYTWEVYDPCTVITLGVFDNRHLHDQNPGGGGGEDARIGKIKIRLSTLETDKVYTHSYPLMVLQSQGLKKVGEVQLAIRFSCSSFYNLLQTYCRPILPRMHYHHPLSVHQLNYLRIQATAIISLRLSRAEPPLRKEVVEYMLDYVGSNRWSLRRSKANYNRIRDFFSSLAILKKWLDQICTWDRPVFTIVIHLLFLIFILSPRLILPTVFFIMFVNGVWNYRTRPRNPPHMDTHLSFAERVPHDELDEEFDTLPTSKQGNVITLRYDRLRLIAGNVQAVAGDLATQVERLQSLLNWRDPRATAVFVTFCLIACIVFFVIPFKVVVSSFMFYMLRHPKFRHKVPPAPLNFFKRLPAKTDSLL
ncbi:FT-interacting protein 3 [Dionaea muscipula]